MARVRPRQHGGMAASHVFPALLPLLSSPQSPFLAGLVGSEVMVTTGANQAFANVVLTLLDGGDAAVLFRPVHASRMSGPDAGHVNMNKYFIRFVAALRCITPWLLSPLPAAVRSGPSISTTAWRCR